MYPSKSNRRVVVCTDSHIDLIIKDLCEHNQKIVALMVEFATITGMRIQEILDLEWSSFNSKYIIFTGKGDRQRIFPLKPFPRVNDIINELKILSPKKPFDWTRQQLPAGALRDAVRRLEKVYPDMSWTITFHVFRKTAINRWRDAGVDIYTRNAIAGHTEDVASKNYLTDVDIEYIEHEFSRVHTKNFQQNQE